MKSLTQIQYGIGAHAPNSAAGGQKCPKRPIVGEIQ